MRTLTNQINLKHVCAILFLSFTTFMANAQDSTTTSTTTRTSKSVTTETTTVEPWVWIVGAAVLIIIIVALVRGNSSKPAAGTTDRVTYTKKVERKEE